METFETSGALNGNGVCLDFHKTLKKVPRSDPDVLIPQNGTGAAKVIKNADFVSHALETENIGPTLTTGENRFEFREIGKGFPNYEGKGLNGIDSAQLNGIDPVNIVEVSAKDGKGISLFVDVFSPVEVFDLPRDSNSVGAESNFSFHENCTVFQGSVEDTSKIANSRLRYGRICKLKTKQELDTSKEEFKFSMGDFVWAKFKTQLWWPGRICDPSNASNVASRTLKEGFLIRYIGVGSFVQCSSHKLKPFVECFEHMSKQSSTRSFQNAIDKAVVEFGMCVKMEMSCSCFPIETETESSAKEKRGEITKFGVDKFEPVTFLAYLKDLSKGVLVPSVIDSVVVQSQLSAYHRAMGHLLLPIDQLLPVSDVAHGKACIDSKPVDRKVCSGYKLRDRCKNLPLVVVNHPEEEKNNSMVESLGEKSKKKKHEKPTAEESSAKMASELRLTALNCLYPCKSKRFDVVFGYFSGFRKFSFLKKERRLVYKAVNPVIINFGNAGPVHSEVKSVPNKRKKAEAAPVSNIRDMKTCGSLATDITKMGYKPASQTVPKKRTKKVTVESLLATHTGDSLLGSNVNVAKTAHAILDLQNNIPLVPQDQVVPKTAMENAKRTPASLLATQTGDGLSGLNVNVATNGPVILDNVHNLAQVKVVQKYATENSDRHPVSVSAIQTRDGSMSLNVNNAENGPVILDFRKNVPFLPRGQVAPKNATENGDGTPAQPHIKEIGDASLFSNLHFKHFAATQGKLEPKKRKKTEASSEKSNVVLPDIRGSSAKFVPVLNNLQPNSTPKESSLLNIKFGADGNNVGPVLLESKDLKTNVSECKLLPDLNEISPEPISNDSVMPKIKPRKRLKVASNEVFDINSDSANKMGTALLLKFADGFPLPSIETLVSSFSGFGQLLQSETIVSSESGSAQVVFTRSCDARDAFINLTKCSPFGPALINYRLHDLSLPNNGHNNDTQTPMLLAIDKPMKPIAPRKPRVPNQDKPEPLVVRAVKARAAFGLKVPQSNSPSDVLVMRQKLEMMTSMMQKAGDKLAPEMKARLEGEINGLMNKIRTMSASS